MSTSAPSSTSSLTVRYDPARTDQWSGVEPNLSWALCLIVIPSFLSRIRQRISLAARCATVAPVLSASSVSIPASTRAGMTAYWQSLQAMCNKVSPCSFRMLRSAPTSRSSCSMSAVSALGPEVNTERCCTESLDVIS